MHNVSSPLGKYGQIAALIACLGTLGAYVAALFISAVDAGEALEPFAILAFGIIVGNVSAINGVKGEIQAANHRLDVINAPPAAAIEKS